MIAWLGYLAADLAVRVLPPRAADALAIGLARLAFHARLPARRAQERNLERLLDQPSPPVVRRCARESFEHFALALGDFLRLDSLAPEALERAVEVRGERHLAAARESGRGVVLLTAHLGNWEWGAAWLAARVRLHVAARPHPSARVERLFRRRRRAWGVATLPWHARSLGAMRALRRGEWVALMADRPTRGTPGRAGSHPALAPPACLLAAALARRCDALVLPAVMIHLPGRRYAACFEPARPPAGAPGSARSARGLGAALARTLARHPGQWCAFEPAPGIPA